ncbi:hypothetical protein MRX96_035971 [Rhipicephalus microplus]
MIKVFVTVLLCLIYVTWNAHEAEAKPRKRRPCHHNGTTLPPGYYGAQEYPCEYWWCRRNGNVSVTKCRQPPPPRDSGYAAPGCGDVNGQSPVTATPSTSNTSSTMTTPSTTTTHATTTTPSTTTTSSTTTAGVPCHYNGTTYNASFHEALRDPCEFWWCLPNGTMEVTKCELELPRPSVYPGSAPGCGEVNGQSGATNSSTSSTDARQGGNERFAVIVNKRGCIRRVLSSYGMRCPLYDKIMPDGRTCLKVIRNQLQERRSVAKLRCWKGYCRDGVCVTTHFSQQCEVPKNRTFTRRPDLLAE